MNTKAVFSRVAKPRVKKLLLVFMSEIKINRMNTKAVFSRVALPLMKIPLLVFMSEIKINLSSEKIKFSVSFMLKCGKN